MVFGFLDMFHLYLSLKECHVIRILYTIVSYATVGSTNLELVESVTSLWAHMSVCHVGRLVCHDFLKRLIISFLSLDLGPAFFCVQSFKDPMNPRRSLWIAYNNYISQNVWCLENCSKGKSLSHLLNQHLHFLIFWSNESNDIPLIFFLIFPEHSVCDSYKICML